MDSFQGHLGYSMPLPVCFDLVEVDYGGRLPTMGGVGQLVVVKAAPLTVHRDPSGNPFPPIGPEKLIRMPPPLPPRGRTPVRTGSTGNAQMRG